MKSILRESQKLQKKCSETKNRNALINFIFSSEKSTPTPLNYQNFPLIHTIFYYFSKFSHAQPNGSCSCSADFHRCVVLVPWGTLYFECFEESRDYLQWLHFTDTTMPGERHRRWCCRFLERCCDMCGCFCWQFLIVQRHFSFFVIYQI